jgi:ABC-type transport system involved in multi-copper enzyme maturation permease subunit
MISPALPLFALGIPTWIKPLWIVGTGVVAAVVLLAAATFLLQLAAPKVMAIARTTGKEAVSQPLFYVLVVAGIFLLVFSIFLPYYTFGEDLKEVEHNGLTLVMVLAVMLALWTASVSVAEEIEGRTALTVLSKPIGRRQFILGKFLGIVGAVFVLFVILGAVYLGCVSYKFVYEARENVAPDPTSVQCYEEIIRVAPGLLLALMEAVVLTAISVAISTRLPMLPNLVICGAIYVLGHLVPALANSAVGQLPMVPFVADLLATILPLLDYFNVYGAISTGDAIPWTFVGLDALYCLLYSTVAILLALLLFEDRDLA